MEQTLLASLLEDIKKTYCRLLGDNLTGIYIHGSIALGSFQWDRSDVDFLAVVKRGLNPEEKSRLMQAVVQLHTHANPRGLEMSVVLEQDCKAPAFPMPYDLHFSGGTLGWYQRDPEGYCWNMRGEDADLASYMAVIKQSGIVLWGKPMEEVFGELPEQAYLQSVLYDIRDAKECFRENPSYHTLNLCRTLAYLEDGWIRSKKAGGEWALSKLPKRFAPMIQSALDAYCFGAEIILDDAPAQAFLQFAFAQIEGGEKHVYRSDL